MRSDLDCYEEQSIVCPYCYEKCEDDCLNVARDGGGEYMSFQCENCGKDFMVQANTTITYTSARLDDNGEIVDTWREIEEGDCKYGYNDCIWRDTDACFGCVDASEYDDECK